MISVRNIIITQKTIRKILSFCLLFSFFQLKAGNIDSLQKVLKNSAEEEQAAIYNEMAEGSYRTEPGMTLVYAKKAMQLSRKYNNSTEIIKSNSNLGLYYLVTGNLDSSEYFLNESLALSKKNDEKNELARTCNRLGAIRYIKGELDSALYFYEKAIPIFFMEKNWKELSKVYSNIAGIHYRKQNLTEALKYYFGCLDADKKLGDKDGIASDYSNIANVFHEIHDYNHSEEYAKKGLQLYEELGDPKGQETSLLNLSNAYSSKHLYDSTLMCLDKAEDLGIQLNDQLLLSQIYNNKGNVYRQRNDLDEALKYYLKSLELKRQFNDSLAISSSLGNIGEIMSEKGKVNEAIKYLNEANEIAEKFGHLTYLINQHKNLSILYQRSGNNTMATEHLQKAIQYQDTLYQEDLRETVSEMETRFKTQEKEAENELLKSENLREKAESDQKTSFIYLIGITSGSIILLGLLLGIVIINRRKLLERGRLAEIEKKQFKVVIEAEEKERTRIAQELHDGLGQLLSTARLNVSGLEEAVPAEDLKLYNNAIEMIDESVQEVRNISHNLMPSALTRYGLQSALEQLVTKVNDVGGITIELHTEGTGERMEANAEIGIFRIIQEFLNNSIRHSGGTLICIALKKDTERIYVSVKDNGKGLERSDIENSSGIGWKSIYSRVSLLNGSVDIQSEPGNGTTMEIVIPLKG